jgi:hypothetical protein
MKGREREFATVFIENYKKKSYNVQELGASNSSCQIRFGLEVLLKTTLQKKTLQLLCCINIPSAQHQLVTLFCLWFRLKQ